MLAMCPPPFMNLLRLIGPDLNLAVFQRWIIASSGLKAMMALHVWRSLKNKCELFSQTGLDIRIGRNMQKIRYVLLAILLIAIKVSFAQSSLTLEFTDTVLTDGKTIKLEAFVYEPANPNGKTILFSHGSTGGKKESIKETIKFMRIGKLVSDNGYRMVAYMRKGRGASEGTFREESGKCDRESLNAEVADAYPQMDQVVDQVRKTYKTDKIILMGHSRGGFLSTLYAAKNPNKISAAVNFAGVWSAFCENSNGGFSHEILSNSASKFKNLYWAYFDNDSYFAADRFNDPNYDWMASTALKYGITFKKYPISDMKDGHLTPTWRPEVWINDVIPWLNVR
jgi:pimeloyl-ACP methyl ester carboxylesterase